MIVASVIISYETLIKHSAAAASACCVCKALQSEFVVERLPLFCINSDHSLSRHSCFESVLAHMPNFTFVRLCQLIPS